MEVQTKPDTRNARLCLRCGECCRRYQVRLDMAEAQRIADELGLSAQQFREKYEDRRWPGEMSLLVRHENGGCAFLERRGENGEELCAIHSFKPSICREWTGSLERRECQAGLVRRWGLVVDSTGELRGPDEKMRDFRLFIDSLARDGRS